MKIVEALWRLVVLTGAAFVQLGAVIFRGIEILSKKAGEFLKGLSGKMLTKLDEYEAEMKVIAAEE